MTRKFFLILLIISLILGFFWAFQRYHHTTSLPTKHGNVYFYSPQSNDHLQTTLIKAIEKAQSSIWIRIYGMTDEKVIKAINQKANSGVSVEINYDSHASKSLKKKLSEKIKTTIYQGKGIGHQKLCIIDNALTIFGSTNFTTKSLVMHDNLLIAVYDKSLAKHLCEQYIDDYKPFTSPLYTFYMLPFDCLNSLIQAINQSKSSLQIAMFTWTHPKLLDAVLSAYKRGVKVEVILDQSAQLGASSKVYSTLRKADVPIHIQKGLQLMHHKLLVIDKSTLITGSANWTKAAFTKNNETLFFYPLKNEEEQRYFQKLWSALWNDTFSP